MVAERVAYDRSVPVMLPSAAVETLTLQETVMNRDEERLPPMVVTEDGSYVHTTPHTTQHTAPPQSHYDYDPQGSLRRARSPSQCDSMGYV